MRIPCSTYRLQLNSSFGFVQAKAIVEYLAHLGISDVYASPIFAACEGSTHGYDVVDPARLNPELGTVEEFNDLADALKTHGMGWLQDIVPNHMAFDSRNRLLMDVLENGQASEYYHFFDIDWNHPYASMKGRLLAPFLGRLYGETLDAGEIRVAYGEEGFSIRCHGLAFPLRIESYTRLLGLHLLALNQKLGADHTDYIKFTGVLSMLKALPADGQAGERADQVKFAKEMLWELYQGDPEIKGFMDGNMAEFNGEEGSKDHDLLDDLLFDQLFRLSFWKVATEEINYRRFFSVNELVSLNMEAIDVFRHCHTLVFDLIRKGVVTGLRVDHIDGLYDPLEYLERLRGTAGEIYLVVEKVLAMNEELPRQWPVQGTSGYDFMNYLNGIFCQQKSEKDLERIYTAFTGMKVDYPNLLHEKKRIIIERFMTGDVDNLAHLMKRISSRDRCGGDFTLYGLKRAIHEVLAFFPVYRTYASARSFSERDRGYITEAVERAKRHNPDLIYELTYLSKFLLLQFESYLNDEEKKDRLHFVMRFQQLTGPLMAKGFEDTTLYVYNRLLALNEVGGEPHSFGVPLDRFHAFNKERAELWPHSMSATSTHDTKRGEDVRARLHVLSEIPEEWGLRVKAWRELNRRKKKRVGGMRAPSRNDEYFIYQTLLGAFPFGGPEEEHSDFAERIKSYVIKAIREAKVHTGWIRTDADYENGCMSFIDALLDPSGDNRFMEDFRPFQKKVAHFGVLSALSQTLVKITSPGVPDFYQGTELWELSLVDPDNRRPVDFGLRVGYLEEIRRKGSDRLFIEELLATPGDGRIKLFLIYRALRARRRNPRPFEHGSYVPMAVEGSFAHHVVAFARTEGPCWVLTVAPRFPASLVGEGQYPLGAAVWKDTRIVLPPGAPSRWRDAVVPRDLATGGALPLGEALEHFPAALLVAGEEGP